MQCRPDRPAKGAGLAMPTAGRQSVRHPIVRNVRIVQVDAGGRRQR